MPPDAPAPTTNAPAPAEPVATPPVSTPKERGAALIAKHVAMADKAKAEEATAELAKVEGATGERERDPKTGHFLPAGKKPKPAKNVAAGIKPAGVDPTGEPSQASGDTTAKPKPEEPVAAGLGKARRLVNEGKIADALQLIGLDPEKLESSKWAAWRHENKKTATAIHEARQSVERERAEVQQSARQLVNDLAPLIRGKQAFDKGDYEEAFQQAFGIDLNTFQRKALQSMASPGVGKDPAVLALRQELQALRQERENERQHYAQAQAQAQAQQRQHEYWSNLTSTLKEAGDPRIAKAAERPAFVRAVFEVQREHYDKSTDSTLPAEEAAELALERLQGEYSEWQQVFGGSAPDENATRTRGIPAATGPSGTSARRTARAVTSLNPSEAAEAAPRPKLKGKDLINYWSNVAKRDELKGLNGG